MSAALRLVTTPSDELDGWELPVPLSGPPPAPSFPVEVFPGWLADMVTAVAVDTQTDPTMGATVALQVLSACAGGRVQVQPKPGWREPVNLFLATVAEPGERKSPVHSALTGPLVEAEEALVAKFGPLATQNAALRDIAEQSAHKAKADAARADGSRAEELTAEAVSAALAVDAIAVPGEPRLLSGDVTPETLASLMAANGGRMAIICDEGGIFDMLAGRYSATPYLEPYLMGHSGKRMRLDRRTRTEYIPKPALTVGVMLQPSVLRKFGGNGDLVGNGMVARFLFTIPTSRAGYREVDSAPVPELVSATYGATIRDLALTLAEWTDPAVVTLTEDARRLHLDQAAVIEVQLRPGGSLRDMREWANKLNGATLRLAGLLHMAHHPTDGWRHAIEAAVMADAVRLAELFIEHHHAALQTIAHDPETGINAHVLGVLIDKGMRQFTRRDLQRKVPRQLPTAKHVVAVLDNLAQLGWIRSTPTSGYELHPRAAELRESVDTLTNALNAAYAAGQTPDGPVNSTVDTPLTALTAGTP